MKVKGLMGSNRTGAALAPARTDEMISATSEFPPSSRGTAEALGKVRASCSASGEPIGSMPPPAGMKQLAKTVVKSMTGGGPVLLLDKLGERLAFERAGTRLWEAMLSKFDAFGTFSGGPTREQIEHIRDEERQHFTMLRELIERLDGDPTAITPSANVQAVASMGLPQALTDPRTNLVQSLEAVLVAELADNACWPALIELLTKGGHHGEAQRFFCAVESEREHLQCVRMWLAAAQGRSVEDAQRLTDAETAALMASPALATIAPEGRDDEDGSEIESAIRESGRGRTAARRGAKAGTGGRARARKRVTAKARAAGAKSRTKTRTARRRKAR